MNYKQLYLLLFFFITCNLYSQQIQIKGKVTDSLQSALPFANVMAEPIGVKKAPVFTMTNEKGNFTLQILKKFSYRVSVMYMGFQTYTFTIDSLSGNQTRNIILKPNKNSLDEVVIVADLPVKVSNDTITYKTDHFKTGEERKLKDVLKKLPGVEIDRNGKITVMGKKVSKVLVENKAFFGGGTKLAIDNIPADAVDKVEAIDDYNSIAFMKGLTDEQKMVLNIKLKEGKKRFVFGDITAGAGNDNYYTGKANLFYYSPKTNLSFIGNINDTGEAPLKMQDFLRFEGSAMDLDKMKSSIQSFKWLSNFIIPKDFTDKTNRFTALQWQQDWGEKIEFSTYVIGSKDWIKAQKQIDNTFLYEPQTFFEIKNIEQQNNNLFGIGKMHFRYKSSVFNYIDMEMSGNYQNLKQDNQTISTIDSNENFILKQDENTQYDWQQQIAWHRRINTQHTFRLQNSLNYKQTTPEQNWLTNTPILTQWIDLLSEDSYHIFQNMYEQKTDWKINLKHYWLINNKNHIYTTLGYQYIDDKFTTKSYQILTDNTINQFDQDLFDNDLHWQFDDAFAGMQYKLKIKEHVFKTGFFVHHYNWIFHQDINKNRSLWRVLPEFLWEYKNGFRQTIRFQYHLTSQVFDMKYYLPKFYLSDYNVIEKGNSNLSDELSHQFKWYIRHYSFVNDFQYYFYLNFSYKLENIKNQLFYYNAEHYSMPVMVTIPEKAWHLLGSIKKDIKGFYVQLKPILSWSVYYQNIQDEWKNIYLSNQNYQIATGSYFQKYPNFELGTDFTFQKNTIEDSSHSYQVIAPYINIDYDFLQSFIFKGEYHFQINQNDDQANNHYQTAKMSLFYQKEKSPWEFEISAQNIFNQEVKESTSYSDFLWSTSYFYQPPFIMMLKVSYKL